MIVGLKAVYNISHYYCKYDKSVGEDFIYEKKTKRLIDVKKR